MRLALLMAVVLTWDRNPDRSTAGYKLYQGSESLTYTNAMDVGASNRTYYPTKVGSSYFFALTAYNSNGLESDFSAELAYTPRLLSVIIDSSVDLVDWVPTYTITITNDQRQQFFKLRIQ